MADNVTINTITGSPVARTDDIGGFHYQVIKIGLGVDGSIDGFVSTTTPMPISDAGGSITVDGTVAVTSAALTSIDGKITACNTGAVVVSSSALPTGAASEASLASLNGKVTAVNTGAVVVSSSALPTGAATAAKQPALGTAGTASTDVITVQGIASGTPQPISDGSGSITVDAPVGTPAFVRLSDGSAAITTLPVSIAGTVTVASHAVTNAGTFAVQAAQSGTWNIGTVTTVTTVAAVTAITNALPAGTNNIGDVDVLTLPALPAGTNNIGDVDVLTQPARSRTVDAIAVAAQTDALMSGLTALTPKFATISGAASGDNALVAAVTSKKIRVTSLFLMSAGTVSAYVRDDAGTPINLLGDATNKLALVSGSGFVLPHNPLGWFETTSGEGLQLNLSAAIGVAGCLSYVEV